MSSILRELAALRPEAARALARRIGAREETTALALAAALPTLVSAFARMAASPEAARLLGASREAEPPAEAVLDAALGERRCNVETQIARQAGIDPAQTRAVLAAAAVLLLGALGRAQRPRHWGADDLSRALTRELLLAEDAVPGSVGVLEELLEGDADVEVGEDVTEVGTLLLARLCDG